MVMKYLIDPPPREGAAFEHDRLVMLYHPPAGAPIVEPPQSQWSEDRIRFEADRQQAILQGHASPMWPLEGRRAVPLAK